MKKTIGLVVLLIATAACKSPATNESPSANQPADNRATTANLSEADFTAGKDRFGMRSKAGTTMVLPHCWQAIMSRSTRAACWIK